jgi:hypothetical protein
MHRWSAAVARWQARAARETNGWLAANAARMAAAGLSSGFALVPVPPLPEGDGGAAAAPIKSAAALDAGAAQGGGGSGRWAEPSPLAQKQLRVRALESSSTLGPRSPGAISLHVVRPPSGTAGGSDGGGAAGSGGGSPLGSTGPRGSGVGAGGALSALFGSGAVRVAPDGGAAPEGAGESPHQVRWRHLTR